MKEKLHALRARIALPELAGILLSACVFLLLVSVRQPFLTLTAAHWSATVLAVLLALYVRSDKQAPASATVLPLLQKAAYVYLAKAAALWLGMVGLDWTATKSLALIVAAELILLPSQCRADSGAMLLCKGLLAACCAVCAGSLDRSYDAEDPLTVASIFLTGTLALLLFYRLPFASYAQAVRSHGKRVWAFTAVMTAGMLWAVGPQIREPLRQWLDAYHVAVYDKLAGNVSFVCVAVVLFWLFSLLCHLALPPVRRFFRGFDRFDKGYLAVSMLLYTAVAVVLAMTTDAFTHPCGDMFTYDNIFTSDTRLLTQGYYNVFTCMNYAENDIRQMLFGVVGIPMGTLAMGFAFLANFLNVFLSQPLNYWHLFGIGLLLQQALLMSLTAIMLRRILRTMIRDGYAKLFTVFFALSYSTVVFTFIVEQYVLGLFTLVAFVYALTCDYSERKACTGMVCATGTMTPSAASFLMLPLSDRRFSLRELLVIAVKTLGLFLAVCLLFGQLTQLVHLRESLTGMVGGFGGVALSAEEKIRQYLEAVSQMLLSPVLTTQPAPEGATAIVPVAGRLVEQIIGAVIAAVALIGVVAKGRRHGGARIAAYWLLISVFVLIIIGWGAREHGMILYASYFYWAFFLLIACAFDAVFRRIEWVGTVLLLAGIAAVGVYNLYGFWQMFRMACEYYPVFK